MLQKSWGQPGNILSACRSPTDQVGADVVTQATIHHTFAPELQPGPWFPSGVDPTTFPAHQDRVPIPDRELWDSNRLEEPPCSPSPPFPFGTDTSLLWGLSWEQEDGYSGPGLPTRCQDRLQALPDVP